MVHYIRTGTYKDEYGEGAGGFHIERGRPPKPLGAVWLRFYLRSKIPDKSSANLIGIDVTLETK